VHHQPVDDLEPAARERRRHRRVADVGGGNDLGGATLGEQVARLQQQLGGVAVAPVLGEDPDIGDVGPVPGRRRRAGDRRAQRAAARRPDGAFGLTGEEADAYRVEFDVVSAALAAGDPGEFGRADAVDQAAVLEAVGRSAASGLPVEPPPSATA
jgi:hypothetical protein